MSTIANEKIAFEVQVRTNVIYQLFVDRIGGAIANVLASSAVDSGIDSWSGQTKNYKISICCFCARHRTLSGQSKDWFALNQDNVSE